MIYQDDTIFHIYNQGNNHRKIFFTNANYLFFLRKIRIFLLPHADFLAYSLMPNHFHFLIYLRSVLAPIPPRYLTNKKYKAEEFEPQVGKLEMREFSDSLAVMLRSYTRAINKQEDFSGSLFRRQTKAKDGFHPELWMSEKAETKDYTFAEGNNYASTCFHYIHKNAVKANLVSKAEDYTYSSARDYKGLRQGTLCNQDLAKKLLFI